MGPKIPTGLTTASSRPPPSPATKSHAARSARVLDLGYGATGCAPERSVQSASVKAWLFPPWP